MSVETANMQACLSLVKRLSDKYEQLSRTADLYKLDDADGLEEEARQEAETACRRIEQLRDHLHRLLTKH